MSFLCPCVPTALLLHWPDESNVFCNWNGPVNSVASADCMRRTKNIAAKTSPLGDGKASLDMLPVCAMVSRDGE